MSDDVTLIFDGNHALHRMMHIKEFFTMRVGDVYTGGVFGFIKMLRSKVYEIKPARVVVCWDKGHSDRRKAIYPEYKSPELDPEEKVEKDNFYSRWRDQRNKLLALLPLLGVRSAYVRGKEGDDVIYQALHMAPGSCVLVSADKDLLQMVSPKCTMLKIKYSKGTVHEDYITPESWKEQEGWPRQEHFLLAKALAGDGSDNIPGIPGVGDGTITKVLTELAEEPQITLEKLHEHCAAHSSARVRKIADAIDKVRLNLQLVDISQEPFTEEERQQIWNRGFCTPSVRDEMTVARILTEYGMMSIMEKWDQWIRPFRSLA